MTWCFFYDFDNNLILTFYPWLIKWSFGATSCMVLMFYVNCSKPNKNLQSIFCQPRLVLCTPLGNDSFHNSDWKIHLHNNNYNIAVVMLLVTLHLWSQLYTHPNKNIVDNISQFLLEANYKMITLMVALVMLCFKRWSIHSTEILIGTAFHQ